MSALVTGVGYIGAVLVRRLLERGERVVGLENFFCTPRDALSALQETPGFTLVEGDVAEPEDVARAFREVTRPGEALTVFHLAAQPSASVAARDPDYTERANLRGARLVLEAARAADATVVFGGSLRVYGDEPGLAVLDEDAPYGRVSDLSHLSKIYVEQLGRMLGGSFVSARLGIVYGLAPIMKREPSFMTVGNLFCQKASRGEPLHVLADQSFGFIHVQDAADALLAAERLAVGSGCWQVANAAPDVASIFKVAQMVQTLGLARERSVEVRGEAIPRPSFEVRSRLTDVGFSPRRSLSEGLGEVFDFFLQEPQ